MAEPMRADSGSAMSGDVKATGGRVAPGEARIGRTLALTQAMLSRREIEAASAKLPHPNLERHARPKRRLLEDERGYSAWQQLVRPADL